MSRVVVIGGGAAGMFAAITAAKKGHQVELFEKNEKLGKKIYITGKGRCNLTNACDMEVLFESVCSNRKFLYSAFYGFTNQDAIEFFESCGMKTKIERGNRVFPVSDHSSDVIAALAGEMHRRGVKVHLNTAVERILTDADFGNASGSSGKDEGTAEASAGEQKNGNGELPRILGVGLADRTRVMADAVIVATGGLSYPSTGSNGDGYRFAKENGHTVTELSPSLVPLNVQEEDVMQMQGLSLRNVRAGVYDGKKLLYEDFGEMMFTHFGVTGPLILSASSHIQKKLKGKTLQLKIDLKPALTVEQLDARILREFEANKNKQFKNILGTLYPAKMIPVIISRSGISPEKPIHDISKEERQMLIRVTKEFQMTITGLRGYNEAIITRGGVSVKEIQPGTMESKKVAGLYFAGEVLDLDAVTGGFNLQIAWSTGYAAGMGIE